jgi:GMP synthase (glutamine-hydrolysing)
MTRILIVDGNTREIDTAHVNAGGTATGAHYARVLQRLAPSIDCTIVHLARGDGLPAGTPLDSFAGVAWTGSALNVYNDVSPVRAQVEFARAVFVAGVPQFGSCWGLQVAATAAGGEVHANPKGREIGVARQVALTPEGARHPMYEGKPAVFDAIAVHMDEVVRLPPQAQRLASNALSAVQALEIRYQRGVFWGTQYHPEYDLNEIATVVQRYGERLIEAGFFADTPTLQRYIGDLRSLHNSPARRDLAWLYGLNEDVVQFAPRSIELKNWLRFLGLT